MTSRRTRLGLVLAGAAAISGMAMAAYAATPPTGVSTSSAVYVERGGSGEERRLEPADRLARGDRIVTIVTWRRAQGSGPFTITNPLPSSLSYQKSAGSDEEVSVDGGRSWGRLADLKVGPRQATPEDITHVRWRISEQSARSGSGSIIYSGIVR